jgi:hypothetical protein
MNNLWRAVSKTNFLVESPSNCSTSIIEDTLTRRVMSSLVSPGMM